MFDWCLNHPDKKQRNRRKLNRVKMIKWFIALKKWKLLNTVVRSQVWTLPSCGDDIIWSLWGNDGGWSRCIEVPPTYILDQSGLNLTCRSWRLSLFLYHQTSKWSETWRLKETSDLSTEATSTRLRFSLKIFIQVFRLWSLFVPSTRHVTTEGQCQQMVEEHLDSSTCKQQNTEWNWTAAVSKDNRMLFLHWKLRLVLYSWRRSCDRRPIREGYVMTEKTKSARGCERHRFQTFSCFETVESCVMWYLNHPN